MAKRKGRHAVRRVRHAVGRARAAMDTRPGKVIGMAGMAAAGGAATSFIINKVPKVRDMSQGTKSAIQGAAGLAAIFLGKKKWIKGLGAGAVIAAAFGGVKAVLKLDPLAGPGAGRPTLSPSQMRRITGGGMNVPASVSMGVPSSVRMRGGSEGFGGGASGWGGGW
jgi:hypothetical protein